jgi:hypothetical protein
MIGFDKRIAPIAESGLDIPPAAGITTGWVTLLAWSKADAIALRLLGPAYLYGHLGGELGDGALPGPIAESFPAGIKAQWVRSSADGLTARSTLTVGESTTWADATKRHPETLTLDDFPLRFQVWQRGGVLLLRKAIGVIDAYDARMAYRHEPVQITELWDQLVSGSDL